MPKVSVYLPEDLYRQVRERGLAVSALTQRAVEEELRRASLAEWISRARATPSRVPEDVDTASLLTEVRAGFGR